MLSIQRTTLDQIDSPADLSSLGLQDLERLANEIREVLVDAISRTGGHLGSNLGIVETTLILHRLFRSPRDVILWDTGHSAYVHKLITGRRDDFVKLRQPGGLSGYPSRQESIHDWVENSHASTILSYADGLASAFALRREERRVVAVIGDGALTGGMAYEGLNNIGFYGRRVIVVLNDNGRSYAPTVSRLTVGESPRDGDGGRHRGRAARPFFEALGFFYTGPIDGHDVARLEAALRAAGRTSGPALVHVVTEKGRGYAPAAGHAETRLHDCSPFPDLGTGPPPTRPAGYTAAFADALVAAGRRRPEVVAITAAMPGSTGLRPFEAEFPERFVDVGMAEQHAVTSAAGLAMGGMRPVVAIYSTFFSRAFDQANLDVALHGEPVVFALDRAGVTGDDGPSHNGVLDMALCLAVPGMTVFAPSSTSEVPAMLDEALELDGPAAIRFPKGPGPDVGPDQVGRGLQARCTRRGTGDVCLLAVGTMVAAADEAGRLLEALGLDVTVWDVRVVTPLDGEMLSDAGCHPLVVTVEDGIEVGGAGAYLARAVTEAAAARHHRDIPRVVTLGTPVRFLDHGRRADILATLGLDGPGIARAVARAQGLEDGDRDR